MLKTFALSTLFIVFFAVGSSEASAQNWKNLGTKEVTDKEESDVFHVGSRKGQFRALKLFRIPACSSFLPRRSYISKRRNNTFGN